jgi:3-(3-hydroxy-phenyl)propionate hydroxylase
LNDYDEERHQAAVQNVLVTNRTARFLRPGNAAERMLRDAAIALAKRNTSLRPYVNTGRMSSPNEYRCTQPGLLPSKRALQNMPIRLANGALAEVLDLLPWVSHHLLVLWFGQTTERQAQALRQCKQRVVQVLACGEKGQHVECVWEPNESAPLRHACSLSDGWALVRPDLYIVATGNNVAHLQSAIRISLGEAA